MAHDVCVSWQLAVAASSTVTPFAAWPSSAVAPSARSSSALSRAPLF